MLAVENFARPTFKQALTKKQTFIEIIRARCPTNLRTNKNKEDFWSNHRSNKDPPAILAPIEWILFNHWFILELSREDNVLLRLLGKGPLIQIDLLRQPFAWWTHGVNFISIPFSERRRFQWNVKHWRRNFHFHSLALFLQSSTSSSVRKVHLRSAVASLWLACSMRISRRARVLKNASERNIIMAARRSSNCSSTK